MIFIILTVLALGGIVYMFCKAMTLGLDGLYYAHTGKRLKDANELKDGEKNER